MRLQKTPFIPGLITLYILLNQSINLSAQCSFTNPAACLCPVPGQQNCVLLPDIRAGKHSLNGATGWTEYSQSAASPNKGLLRIDVSTPNTGWGPVEVIATSDYVCGTDTLRNFTPPSGFLCPDGSFPKRLIKQRVYEKNGNTLTSTLRDAGWMVYHPTHGHIHIEGWGLYTLRMRDASVADTLQWPVVNSGIKVSFCLIDLTTCSGSPGDCLDANGNTMLNNNFPNYGLGGGYGCNDVKQGISVGKVDIYHRGLDESFVKIPYEACSGNYQVVVQVDPDNHFLEMSDNNNWLSAPVTLTQQRATNTGPYSYIFSKMGNTICQGGSIQLEASGASNYVWSTGATTQKINIAQPGKYWVRSTTPCGIATSDTLNIIQTGNSSFPAITRADTICAGEHAFLFASGNAQWYDAPVNGNLVFTGNNFETGNLYSNTTFYVIDQPSVLGGRLGPAGPGFTPNTNFTGTRNDYLIFNAFLPFKLKKLTVNASVAGVRIIQLRDQYGHLIQQKQVTLTAGQQDVTVDFFVPAGLNHQLGLSSSSPVASLLSNTVSSGNIGYPFTLKSIGNIVGSSSGDALYPYFTNWDVEVISMACNDGSRKPVTVMTVPAPAVHLTGVNAQYSHAAPAVKLTGEPGGGTFSGHGVINDYFYPRIAGLGSHIITYTYNNGVCEAQDAKSVSVTVDSALLTDGYSAQLFNTPGTRPVLWVMSSDNAVLDIAVVNSAGQLLRKMQFNALPGPNFFNLSFETLPKAVYFMKIINANNQKSKVLKFVN
ncbi:MAG: hypothetical protein IPP93_07955 [Chitinophagaceae bacterium]|nr:hypothetical protein [Chitinophagaceae bacterium]MBL0336721.1 hypothetical protein [Chitinophagaceae bacterium]